MSPRGREFLQIEVNSIPIPRIFPGRPRWCTMRKATFLVSNALLRSLALVPPRLVRDSRDFIKTSSAYIRAKAPESLASF